MSYKETVINNIIRYCKSNYIKINNKMKPGKGKFNNRCQYNAVQEVVDNNADDVYLCIVVKDKFEIEPSEVTVHIINGSNVYTNKDIGEFVDTTFTDNSLGWVSSYYDYYLVRKIPKTLYDQIDDVLHKAKEDLLYSNSNRFLRFIYKITTRLI